MAVFESRAVAPETATRIHETPRYRSGRDVLLFVHALRLVRRAARVQVDSIAAVAAALLRVRGVPHGAEPPAAARAASRAARRLARWRGALDSCLTRALVAGALLADRDDVVLHVGFRPGSAAQPVDGHAWLTVSGTEVHGLTDHEEPGPPYVETLAVPMRREVRG